MKDICDQLPETLEGVDLDNTGYHRRCYQSFAANVDRLKPAATPSSSMRYHSPRKSIAGTESVKFSHNECIFCEKKEIKAPGNKTQRPTNSFTSWKNKESGWVKIESMAEALENTRLLRKVKGTDLFAAEAHFHEICYHRFFSDYHNHMSKLTNMEESGSDQARMTAAHKAAYNVVKELIMNQVIDKQQVLPLTVLRDRYVVELNAQGTPNPDYRSTKLMAKIEKDSDLARYISFAKVCLKDRGCLSMWLVYCTTITLDDAIASAYKLGTVDFVKHSALCLRQSIEKAFHEMPDLPWPPTADELNARSENEVPETLKEFLHFVISGSDSSSEQCEKTQRLIYSIGQDLCRAVTNGEWKLSKHILLCTAVRHLFRSRQLTTILTRLGHCESYDFGLELETAISKALDEESSFLTPHIICGEGNAVFHSEWDNLNRITTNIHGSNVVNSAGGIMVQETKPDTEPNNQRTLPLYDRSKQRSLTIETPETLPPLTLYKRDGPKFPDNASFLPPDDTILGASLQVYYTWLLCR